MSGAMRTSILGLLRWCCPSAIAGLIIAIVIYPVDGFARRAFAHVGIEIVKDEPSFANGDAAPAIVFVPRLAMIGASPNHRYPRIPGWGTGEAMPCKAGSYRVLGKAAARAHGASSKIVGNGNSVFRSAVAVTEPCRSIAASVRSAPDDREFTVSVPGNINE